MKEYINAWNETMTRIWRDRILQQGIFESPRRRSRAGEPHLAESIRAFPVRGDGRVEELVLQFSFPVYGLYVEAGTGREKSRGNSGDIGKTTASGKERKWRERRPWFSKAWYSSVMNLTEYVARETGEEFKGVIASIAN